MKWAKSWHTPRRLASTSRKGVDTLVAFGSNLKSAWMRRVRSSSASGSLRPAAKLGRRVEGEVAEAFDVRRLEQELRRLEQRLAAGGAQPVAQQLPRRAGLAQRPLLGARLDRHLRFGAHRERRMRRGEHDLRHRVAEVVFARARSPPGAGSTAMRCASIAWNGSGRGVRCSSCCESTTGLS